jgi:hypothetical protein
LLSLGAFIDMPHRQRFLTVPRLGFRLRCLSHLLDEDTPESVVLYEITLLNEFFYIKKDVPEGNPG